MTRQTRDWPLRTPDRRYIIVRERLWRASNPQLDDEIRERLIAELMKSRREVARALRRSDKDAERAARSGVNAAKVALGERGAPWWNDAPDLNRRRVENTPYAQWYEEQVTWERRILELLAERSAQSTVCPSEVARRYEPERWRQHMTAVRDAARRLAAQGQIEIRQRGKILDPVGEIRGAVRLAPNSAGQRR